MLRWATASALFAAAVSPALATPAPNSYQSPHETNSDCLEPGSFQESVISSTVYQTSVVTYVEYVCPTAEPSPTATQPIASAAPHTTLPPHVHWSCDTKKIENIIPVEAKQPSELYYGVNDPSKSGPFAYLRYNFTSAAVNLDHTDHITAQYDQSRGMVMTCGTDEAFQYATDHWTSDMILITFTEGCGSYSDGERCYFKVDKLDFDQQTRVIVATGSAEHPDEMMESAETEWGWWTAKEQKGSSGRQLQDGCQGQGAGVNESGTACQGPDADDDEDLERRGLRDLLKSAVDKTTNFTGAVANSLLNAANADISWNIPSDPQTQVNASTPATQSPWGNANHLFTWGNKSDPTAEYMDVYCVGCGSIGHATLAGKAKWSPTGIEAANMDVQLNMNLTFQLGVEGRLNGDHTYYQDIFVYDFSGISWSHIAIGPYITAGVAVTMNLYSNPGRLLLGGTMSVNNSLISVDYADENDEPENEFDAQFTPVFETQGDVDVRAVELSMPMGIKFGLKIWKFERAVGIVDVPGIRTNSSALNSINNSTTSRKCSDGESDLAWRNRVYAGYIRGAGIPQGNATFDTGYHALPVCIPRVDTWNPHFLPSKGHTDPNITGTPFQADPPGQFLDYILNKFTF